MPWRRVVARLGTRIARRYRRRCQWSGQPDVIGETIYDLDAAARRVEFLYVESAGGVSHGRVETLPEALLFVDARYVSDGETMTYRARWTRQGDAACEAWSELQTPKGWVTMFRMVLKHTDRGRLLKSNASDCDR